MNLYSIETLLYTIGHVCASNHIEATLKFANAFGFNSLDEYVEHYPGKFNRQSIIFSKVEYLMHPADNPENDRERLRLLFGVYSIGDPPIQEKIGKEVYVHIEGSVQACAEAMVTPKVKDVKDCYQTFYTTPNVNIWYCEDWQEETK